MKRGVALLLVLVLVLALGAAAFAAFDLGTGGGSTRAAGRTTTTSTVKFSGADSGPFCEADQRFNAAIAQQTPTTKDPGALRGDYERKLTAVQGLDALAPAEIKQDVATILAAYRALGPALDKVGYDTDKVAAADREKVETDRVRLAGVRLNQYDAQVCKLSSPTTQPSR